MNAIDIVKEQVTAYEQGKDHAVVTIVQADRAMPRTQGKMLVYADGSASGTVGGGAIERLVLQDAVQCIRENRGVLLRSYDLTSAASEEGLACGGCLSVLIETYAAAPLLVMCGGGHVGRAVLQLAGFLGFQTLLLDDREDGIGDSLALAGRFCRVRDFEADLREIPLPAGAYIVIAGHSHAHDGAALAGALDKQAAYVGMIGSARKVAALFDRLRERGVAQAALDGVHTPIGLDLGGETPEEIALSIMAEILMVRHGRGGAQSTPMEKRPADHAE